MNPLKEYQIHFVGLELGNHKLEFEVDDKFFEQFEFSQIKQGKVLVNIDLEKMARLMVFNFDLEGSVRVTCDRCSNEFDLPISDKQKLIVKFGLDYMEESDDVIVIPETDHKFDVAPYIYEFIHLALPVRSVHPDDEHGNSTCDPDMMQRLEKLAPTEIHDPRWEALQKLKMDDK